MCGIFGMLGKNAVSNTLQALKYLEYRGYDSAGVAANRGNVLDVRKTDGRVSALVELMEDFAEADAAIGHTRWATHGKVCKANAHPFVSADGSFAIVHNGIIENHSELRSSLQDVEFTSQTDSEVVAHLLQREYTGDVLQTVFKVAGLLSGSFAVVITSVHQPGKLYAFKRKSPLVVGLSEEAAYLCSDIRCISRMAKEVAVAPDDTVVELSRNGVRFFRFDGASRTLPFFTPERAEEMETTDGDFMLKEIFEIPSKLTLAQKGYYACGGMRMSQQAALNLSRVYLIGCGTAYHSGLEAAAVARHWLDVDLLPVIASEFIYGNYPVDNRTLAIFISQSGETADTVRACERVIQMGGLTYAVTNTGSSSLTFACSRTLNICAGAEYAVASTKAYNCQLVTLLHMLLDLGRMRGTMPFARYSQICSGMDELPQAVQSVLDNSYQLAGIAEQLKDKSAVFYIGRAMDYPTACEGSLKLKEISYIHSEAYPAGELKHGTLALMDDTVAVVAISGDEVLRDKMESSVNEVATRGAAVIGIAPYEFKDAQAVLVPKVHPYLFGIVAAVPLQLIAYYTAKRLGRDVDKPRHLAKSVTVE